MANRRERRAGGAAEPGAVAPRSSSAPGRSSAGQSSALSSRYGTSVRRNALAPGLLGAIGLLAGLALIGGSGFIVIEYAVTILAAIVAVYAYQAKQWWWIPVLAAIAVLWNPLWPFAFTTGRIWLAAQVVGAGVFVACAVLIKQPDPDAHHA